MGCLLALYADRIKNLVTRWSGWFFVAAVPVIALLDTLDVRLVTNLLVTLCVARVVFVPVEFLNAPLLVRLGKLSYPLYLFQQLFLDSISGKPSIPVPFPFNLAAAVAASLICYYVVEVPFFGLRRKFRSYSTK
jgi:peptidoglycan/LPS O-acetylase OafA/YrhL